MARVAHAMSAAWHRNQITAISQPKDADRNLRNELNGSLHAPLVESHLLSVFL